MLAPLATVALAFPSYAVPGQPGTPDANFGVAGIVVADSQPAGHIVASMQVADGTTLHPAICAAPLCLLKYLRNGSADATFGTAGRVAIPTINGFAPELGGRIARQSDGKLLLSAACSNTIIAYRALCLLRFTPNGGIDSSFGNGGVVPISIGPYGNAIPGDVKIGADGKILVTGSCQELGTFYQYRMQNACAARVTPEGNLDSTFGDAGTFIRVRSLGINPSESTASLVEILPDGAVILIGYCQSSGICALKLTPDGTLDVAFGSSGEAVPLVSPLETMETMLALRSQVSVTGVLSVYGRCGSTLCVARVNGRGQPDTSFGIQGQISLPYPGLLRAVDIQGDGRIIAAGDCGVPTESANDFCVARYLPDGSVDITFGQAGRTTLRTKRYGFAVDLNAASSAVFQDDGRVLVAGGCSNPLFASAPVCMIRLDGGPHPNSCGIDVDGDGSEHALTDGLLLIRTALGLTGDAVISGIAFRSNALRKTWDEISDYIQRNAPDVDGDGKMLPGTDALIVARLLFGYRESAVLDGVVFPASSSRRNWITIRDYVSTTCGLSAIGSQ